jgi:3-oxoacyl-[acyl-carrier protein] reductase
MLLANKVALITGAARGTGAGIAQVFAAEGASVIINQVKDEGDPEKVLENIQLTKGRACIARANITDETQVVEMVRKSEEQMGKKIDILVNNYAATIPGKRFMESSWSMWQEQIDTTLKGAFLCTQAVLPGMKEQRWGRIISINTIGIYRPASYYHGYTAAKTAMLGFTRNLAVEMGQYNITVNIVAPGLTLTEEVTAMLTAEAREKHEKSVPLRRTGTVEDTARAALFFASELGSFITGLCLPVCGGQVME